MVVLITGSEGFIGSHLAELLVARGEQVVCTYHNESHLWRLASVLERVTLVPMDVRRGERVDRVIAEHRPDTVHHLAAQSLPTVSWEEPVRTLETNVVGTVHVIEALKRHSPEARVVVACSSAEYGLVGPGEVPVPEDRILRPLHPYGVSKVAQDLLSYQYHHNFGTRALIARIFNTTGPRKEHDVIADLTRRMVEIELGLSPPRLRVGNLEPRRDFTDVRDMVRALDLLAARGRPGVPYNMCTGTTHSIREVLDIILGLGRAEVEVATDPELLRPSDEPVISGSNARLVADTRWAPEIPIERTVGDMLDFWRAFLGDRPK